MGQTATEIEFDLERQRHALTARVSRLKRRVGDDMETTRHRAAGHVRDVKHSITSTGETAAKKVGSVAGTTAGSGTAVAEHPKTLVGAAAAGGFALGLVRGDSEEQDQRPEGRRGRNSEGKKRHGPHLGSLADVARGFVAAQAARLVDTAMGAAKSSLKSAVTGKTNPAKVDQPGDGQQAAPAPDVRTERAPQLSRGDVPIIRDMDQPPSESREAIVDPYTA